MVGCQCARDGTNSAAVMRVLLTFTVVFGLSLSLWGCAQTPRTLRVLQTSDVHGYYGAPEGEGPHAGTGGLRQLASLIEEERAARDAVLLVDSGDMWSGTQLSDRNEGALGVLAFNALGYAAAALGNHEFDYGPVGPRREGGRDPFGSLKKRLAEASFPILAANLLDRSTKALPQWTNLRSSVVVEAGGFKIGIVGVITEDTPAITFPHVGDQLIFTDATEAVIREARLLSAQTLERARVLVPALPGIKRLQKIIYTQLQRAMLGQVGCDQAVRRAAKEWNQYSKARWPNPNPNS